MNPRLKRGLELLLVPIAAAIVFFEQVLIKYLNAAMAAFARLPWIARFEAWLETLPPWGAFIAFIGPSALILPVKLSAVWFVINGYYTTAVVVVVAAHVINSSLVTKMPYDPGKDLTLRNGFSRIDWDRRDDTAQLRADAAPRGGTHDTADCEARDRCWKWVGRCVS